MVDDEEAAAPGRAPPPGLGLGERLRSARKARALTVAQVAEALRLEEPMVIALEEGRFEAMGAPVFVRGHLRRYAALVGLGAEAVLEAYRAAAPGSDAPPVIARPPRTQADPLTGPWLWWALGAVVLLVLVVAIGSGDGDEEAAPAGVAVQPALPLPEPAASPLPEPAAPPLPGPEAPPGAAPAAPAPAPAPVD